MKTTLWGKVLLAGVALHLILPVLAWQCPSDKCECGSSNTGNREIFCPHQYDKRIEINLTPRKTILIECINLASSADWSMLEGMQMDPVEAVTIKRCPFPPANFTNYVNTSKAVNLSFEYLNLMEDIPPQFFQNMTTLKKLKFENIDLRDQPDDMLHGLTSLTSLFLPYNKLERLPVGFLENVPDIKFLELGGNKLKRFEPGFWDNSTRLRGLNLWINAFEVLDATTFFGLRNLTSLDLSINKISSLGSDAFKDLNALDVINLSKNPLSTLASDLFNPTPELRLVRLSDNRANLSLPHRLFAGLHKLEVVDLSRSRIEFLPEDLFAGSDALVNISLEGNVIRELPMGLFDGLANLERLNLSKNRISEIPDRLFQSLGKLVELNLGYNRIKIIQNEAFINLGNLRELNIQRNGLIEIHDVAFYHLQSLRKAHLSHNFLTVYREEESFRLGHSVFRHCHNLEELHLANNSIHVIFEDWNNVLSKLSLLNLSHNQISILTGGGMTNVFDRQSRLVDLTYNNISQISQLDNLATNERSAIVTYNISHNPVICDGSSYDLGRYVHRQLPSAAYMYDLVMTGLQCSSPPNLKGRFVPDLELDEYMEWTESWNCPVWCDCHYRNFDTALLVNCSNLGLNQAPDNLPQLDKSNHTILLLQHNNLTTAPNLTAPGFDKVTELFLSHNQITEVPPEMATPKLKTLMLDNNKLSRIGNGTLSKLAEAILDAISLYGNPWQCDCSTRDLLNWIQTHNNKVISLNEIFCTDSRPLGKLSIDEICTAPVNILVSMTMLAAIGVLVAASVAVYYRFEYDVKVWLFAHKWCMCLVTEDELDRDKRFDAFVSFSHKDEQFVVEELVPRLEASGLTLCLHYRDWVAGEFIPNQIARSVDASRRTLVVLSPSFIESVWGRMEFRSAHKQALSEGRARVVMLVYGDVPPKEQLDPELKSYITMNTYVKWGDPWFWDKLRYALPHAPLPPKKSKKFDERIELMYSGVSPANTPTTPVTNGVLPFPVITSNDPPVSSGAPVPAS